MVVLFLFLLTILYFETRFDYEDNMQDINNWLGYSILVCSAYKIIGVEPFLGLVTFNYYCE